MPAVDPPRQISVASFERAIVENEMALHFQPIVNLVDETLTGFEALVRWNHPSLGLLSAASFIALAESQGRLIRALDDWVLDAACGQLAAWQEDALVAPGFQVAVNVSGAELDGARILERLANSVARSGVETRGLVIEVTESLAVESLEVAIQTSASLQRMGIELAIDDFGMQHSWLSRLHALPFDVLKIDREFVQGARTESGAAFMCAVVTLGNALGLRIVAEGIETAEQARAVRALGCHEGQGYFFSRAMSGPAATQLLLGGIAMSAIPQASPWCAELVFA